MMELAVVIALKVFVVSLFINVFALICFDVFGFSNDERWYQWEHILDKWLGYNVFLLFTLLGGLIVYSILFSWPNSLT